MATRPTPNIAERLAGDPSPAECAAALGVSLRTVRNYISRGQLKTYRVGPKLLRIRAADLEAFLQPVPTTDAA